MCKTAHVLASSNIRNSAGDDLRGMDFPFFTSRDSDMASELYARRREYRERRKRERRRNGEEAND